MSRCWPLTLILALASVGTVGPGASAWAHSPFEPGTEVASQISTGSAETNTLGNGLPGRASEPPGIPGPALPIVAAAVALGGWRPRRATALVLVVLLAVFAFEDGLHSVHHGLDQAQASSCAVAAAGANLSATAVDGVSPCDVILSMAAVAVEARPSDSIAPLVSPEHGRAPPRSLV